jgi:hypothetical protein
MEALKLLDAVLNDIENESVPTSALLMRCQRIANLLDLAPKEHLWIDLELQGYPPQSPARQVPQLKYQVPMYRSLRLPSRATWLEESISKSAPSRYYITEPIAVLESCTVSMDQCFASQVEDNVLYFEAELSPERARGIAQAVRSLVNDFAAKQRNTLAFESSIESLFDGLRLSLADRLSQLDQSLLSLLEETITKEERAISPVDLRDVLDNLRTIIRRFTSLTLTDKMVPAGETRPLDDETRKKTRMVCTWIRAQLSGTFDTESKRIEVVLDSIEKQQAALIDAINKMGHGEMVDVRKHEVDHILLFSVLWLEDFVQGLSRAGFKWPSSRKGRRQKAAKE